MIVRAALMLFQQNTWGKDSLSYLLLLPREDTIIKPINHEFFFSEERPLQFVFAASDPKNAFSRGDRYELCSSNKRMESELKRQQFASPRLFKELKLQ
jgi:hypothetical protein